MSSISSSNPNDPTKLREYYSRRENEIDGKHKTEIETLKKTHSEELEHIRDQASSVIDESRTQMKEKITEYDRKHQQDIEAIKTMYQKKLEDQAKKS